ncbi:hypothetical protein ANCDUO_06138 [Ancylostoma duodenale]|uniref:Uncharacterized protein n=1 Tax=Ancylostoma duodenale TaxID=51022 RepID=A0A0C2GWW2_9BILA|nr:hypothetical protein ANCDUO_06138 [Ancylostoma duodenale]
MGASARKSGGDRLNAKKMSVRLRRKLPTPKSFDEKGQTTGGELKVTLLATINYPGKEGKKSFSKQWRRCAHVETRLNGRKWSEGLSNFFGARNSSKNPPEDCKAMERGRTRSTQTQKWMKADCQHPTDA